MKLVAHPRSKPLMIFDGDCHFCRRWIERWREKTHDRVDYASSQEVGEQFPEISQEEFRRSVQFIETDGRVFRGAEAVFRSLGYARFGAWLSWSYGHVPGFAALTEMLYTLVARHRGMASAVTRLLWGDDVRTPTYFFAREIFVRLLGVIFLFAFLSLWSQVDGLIGREGILPVEDYLRAAHEQLGARAFYLLPTFCWLNASNTALHCLCLAGAGISVLLALGFAPGFSLAILYLLYLSLVAAGQTFSSFQWDILLLETSFLGIFFAPWCWRMTRRNQPPLSRVGLFLLQLLLFKLMLMSGVVKLTSGDDSWWNLTALNFHYQTQPLPTVLGWWAHQGPEWFRKFSTAFVLAVECVAPFLIWAPRRLRMIGFVFLVALQVLIALTGNYAFFNLLTIALCLLLVDDRIWGSRRYGVTQNRPTSFAGWQRGAGIAVLVVTLPISAGQIFSAFRPDASWPRPITTVAGAAEPFRIANDYGLFRVMTKTRPEIIIEGSADGIDWTPYSFKWKPGDLNRAPRWVAPHQPRLDWQMWFAALGSPSENRWFLGLLERLLQSSPSVLGLLERNPFPDKPPRFVRAILYRYEFTTSEERRQTGNWWKRQEKREYVRPVSLQDG